MKAETTDVIFRKWPDESGAIIALFPGVAGSVGKLGECLSYMRVGQHGAASVDIVSHTKPATPDEFAPLKRELERIGYTLRIVKRFTQRHLEQRRRELSRV